MHEDQLSLFPPISDLTAEYEDQNTPASCVNPYLPGFEPPHHIPLRMRPKNGELSPSAQAVAQLVMDGMSPADAGLTVGYRTSRAGDEIMKRPEVRSAMVEAMERRGINRGLLAKVMKRGLKAKARVYHHGQMVDEFDDHGTQHRFLVTALDAFDDKKKSSDDNESFEELIFQIHARRRISQP